MQISEVRQSIIRARAREVRHLLVTPQVLRLAAGDIENRLFMRLAAGHYAYTLHLSARAAGSQLVDTPFGSLDRSELWERAQGIVEYELPLLLYQHVPAGNRRAVIAKVIERLRQDEIVQCTVSAKGFHGPTIELHRSRLGAPLFRDLVAWIEAVVDATIACDQALQKAHSNGNRN